MPTGFVTVTGDVGLGRAAWLAPWVRHARGIWTLVDVGHWASTASRQVVPVVQVVPASQPSRQGTLCASSCPLYS
jgi:hypothetical protein